MSGPQPRSWAGRRRSRGRQSVGMVNGREQRRLQGRQDQDETLGNTHTYGNSIKPYTLIHSECLAAID